MALNSGYLGYIRGPLGAQVTLIPHLSLNPIKPTFIGYRAYYYYEFFLSLLKKGQVAQRERGPGLGHHQPGTEATWHEPGRLGLETGFGGSASLFWRAQGNYGLTAGKIC